MDYVKYYFFDDLSWDWIIEFNYFIWVEVDRFNFGDVNVLNFNMFEFYFCGGKVLIYYGYVDGLIFIGVSFLLYDNV